MQLHSDYIEERNGGYYVSGTRISLDSVVYALNRGDSPQRILERYPLLEKLGKVYGAIAFYLDHQTEIDRYLQESQREFESNTTPLSDANPAFWEKLQRARARAENSRP
jgi:uncharacterized protein (DUF433 family)